MSPPETSTLAHFDVLKAANRVPGGGLEFPMATLMDRAGLRISIYAPRGEDHQQPHLQDEIYFVIRGSGHFSAGGQRCSFNTGDLLFVPAGVEHQFQRFTGDLLLWVACQGPAIADVAGSAADGADAADATGPRSTA